MPIYSLTEYSSNYFDTTGGLRFYSKDKATAFGANITNANNFTSSKQKTQLFGDTIARSNPNQANEILENTAIAVSLKYPSNFCRSLEIVNCSCKV